jgi:hypothetical protein
LGTPGNTYQEAEAGEIYVGTSQIAGGDELTVELTAEMPGTVTAYTLVSGAGAPNFTSPAPVKNFHDGDFLYIQSEGDVADQGETIIYKLRLTEKDDDLTINTLTIGGQSVTQFGAMGLASLVGDEAYGSYYYGASGGGSVSITTVPADLVVAATMNSATSKVYYDHTQNNLDYLVGGFTDDTGHLGNLGSGLHYIALRVENELGEQGWYKFTVGFGRTTATISGLTVGGATVSLGTPGSIAMGAMYVPEYTGALSTVTLTTAQAGDGSTAAVIGTPADGATVRYDWGAVLNFGFPSYLPSGNWNTDGTGLFNGGSFFYDFAVAAPGVNGALIFVEVTSENGLTSNVYAVSCTVAD